MKSGVWAASSLGARNDHFQYTLQQRDPLGYEQRMRSSHGIDLGTWPTLHPSLLTLGP